MFRPYQLCESPQLQPLVLSLLHLSWRVPRLHLIQEQPLFVALLRLLADQPQEGRVTKHIDEYCDCHRYRFQTRS